MMGPSQHSSGVASLAGKIILLSRARNKRQNHRTLQRYIAVALHHLCLTTAQLVQVEKTKFDVTTLHSQPKLAAQQRMVDDGSGQVDVFRVENNSLVQVCVTFFPKVKTVRQDNPTWLPFCVRGRISLYYTCYQFRQTSFRLMIINVASFMAAIVISYSTLTKSAPRPTTSFTFGRVATPMLTS